MDSGSANVTGEPRRSFDMRASVGSSGPRLPRQHLQREPARSESIIYTVRSQGVLDSGAPALLIFE